MLIFKVANSGCSVVFSADSGDNFRFSLSFDFGPCHPSEVLVLIAPMAYLTYLERFQKSYFSKLNE